MTKWEYIAESCPDGHKDTITMFLNKMGREGWELITITTSVSGWVYLFKRPYEK